MINLIKYLLVILVFTQCATPSAPTGGPRDAQPPKLLNTQPPNYTTNFASNKIDFYFDESVSINPNFVKITPRVEEFKVTHKKNHISVEIKEDLNPNTTYQINFSNKIVDINEGNALTSLLYVFSTGDKIDSLKISGKAKLADTKEKFPDNAKALLYKKSPYPDSLFTSSQPDYFATISPTGDFEINYLRRDTFYLFLLADNNLNYYYDLPTEYVGFKQDIVIPSDSVKPIEIVFFLPEPGKIKLSTTQRKTQNNRVVFELNKELEKHTHISFKAKDSTCIIKSQQVGFTNSIEVYFYPQCKGSQRLYAILNDSSKIDSFTVSVVEQPIKPKYKFPEFIDASKDSSCVILDVLLTEVKPNSYLLNLDSVATEELVFPITSFTDNRFCFKHPKKTIPKELNLFLKDSMLLFHDKYMNDTSSHKKEYLSTNELSTLTLTIESIDTNYSYILYLLNEKKERVSKTYITDNQNIMYKNLLPKSYYLEVVEDKNNNGKRDMGSFKLKELPERIFIEEKSLILKANWEIEHTVNLKNF